ncbi:MAG: response regulator [Chloroflexi bacterium]|nr:response regulator [Chloroflexota bacterium]
MTDHVPTLLLIDDDKEILSALHDAMSADGYTCYRAENGMDGFLIAVSEHPDAIILDVNMPTISGFDTLRLLRDNPSTRDIPVVLVSGDDARPRRLAGYLDGADAFLSKPYDLREIEAIILVMLRRLKSGRR